MTKFTTKEKVRRAVHNHGIYSWKLRECSICSVGLYYTFDGEDVFYQYQCDCSHSPSPKDKRSYADVANIFNMQGEEIAQRMWNEFLASGTGEPKPTVRAKIMGVDLASGPDQTSVMIGNAFLGRGGFTDANYRPVESLDVVQYYDGRRGILLEALSDGDAYVLFRKSYAIEIVKWCKLCKVPELESRDHK